MLSWLRRERGGIWAAGRGVGRDRRETQRPCQDRAEIPKRRPDGLRAARAVPFRAGIFFWGGGQGRRSIILDGGANPVNLPSEIAPSERSNFSGWGRGCFLKQPGEEEERREPGRGALLLPGRRLLLLVSSPSPLLLLLSPAQPSPRFWIYRLTRGGSFFARRKLSRDTLLAHLDTRAR